MPDNAEQRTYDVLHVLGRGGFGTVYRARLRASGGFTKEVALKVLNPELASSEDIVRRLRDEARMLGLLRHRAIVHVDGLVRLDDRWAIVMEFVEGASLRDVLELGPIPTGVALEICEEVAAALEVAYDKPGSTGEPLRLLHRDIKPGNIQLTTRGEVKLLDFGVARADFGGREAETRSLIFGSINYLAPERMDFEDTHKGDIYALAVTLYEMLMGEALDKASVNPRKHSQRVEQARQRLRERLGDSELADFVASALVYEPDDRPDARTFERAARELRRGYSEPWLRDWAEHAVDDASAHRKIEHDDWSGASLAETAGSLASATLAFDRDEVADAPEPVRSAEQPSPGRQDAPGSARERALAARQRRKQALQQRRNDPERRAKLARARELRRQRSRRRWRWVLGIGGTLVVLLVVLFVVVPIVATGGLVWLLDVTGIWDDAWNTTVTDSFVELEPLVDACADGPERDAVSAVLQRGQAPDTAGKVGLLELINIENTVQNAAADGVLTPDETREIQRVYAEITTN